jgi:hypothetical protein
MNLKETLENIHKSKNNFFNINEKIYVMMDSMKIQNLFKFPFFKGIMSYKFSKDLIKTNYIVYGIDSKKPYKVYENSFCERL